MEELYFAAVKHNGLALEFLDKRLQTQELCLAAVKQNGEALEFVLPEFQTFELCKIAHIHYFKANKLELFVKHIKY